MKNTIPTLCRCLRHQRFLVFLLTLSLLPSAQAYERIVSTTGNASEVIFNLGFNNQLVAVDTTSTLPADIMSKKPKIGYRRALSSEGILSMAPDLLVLAPDAGPPAVVKQLRAANIDKIITLKNEKTVDGVVEDITLIAKTLNAESQAQKMIGKIRRDEASIQRLINSYPRRPKMAFFMDGGIGRFMGLGNGTAGDGMIGIVGAKNVFAKQFNSIKMLSMESLVTSDIDMLVIASHGGKKNKDKSLQVATGKYPKLAMSKAGKNGCIFTIGTVEALGFGPNLTDAAKQIAKAAKRCTAR